MLITKFGEKSAFGNWNNFYLRNYYVAESKSVAISDIWNSARREKQAIYIIVFSLYKLCNAVVLSSELSHISVAITENICSVLLQKEMEKANCEKQ